MEILDRKTTEKKFWKVYAEQKRAMEQMSQELAQKKALVDQVEGSKAWKVYRAIKGGLVMGNILWSVDKKNIQ